MKKQTIIKIPRSRIFLFDSEDDVLKRMSKKKQQKSEKKSK